MRWLEEWPSSWTCYAVLSGNAMGNEYNGATSRREYEVAPSVSPIDVDINENVDWAIIGSHVMGCALSPCLPRKIGHQNTKSGKFSKNTSGALHQHLVGL